MPDGTVYYSEDLDLLQRMQGQDGYLDRYQPFDYFEEVGFDRQDAIDFLKDFF
jgi:hypothetical protein